jgi:muramoyltetrapeptide carboxypeptidase LdcA involved in peptidoglycan recycling
MLTPQPLKKGDKVAVICLSSGVIGEPYCAHEKELGEKKLREMGLEPVFTRHALRGLTLSSVTPRLVPQTLKKPFLMTR